MDEYEILKKKILELSRTIDSQNDALNLAAKEYSRAAQCHSCKMNMLCNKCYVDFPEYYTPCEEVIKRHWVLNTEEDVHATGSHSYCQR